MFRMSSNLMYSIERVRPMPAVSIAKQTPTIKTKGKLHTGGWPDNKQTIESGINPIVKLTKPAIVEEKGKICGGIYTLVRTALLLEIESAEIDKF